MLIKRGPVLNGQEQMMISGSEKSQEAALTMRFELPKDPTNREKHWKLLMDFPELVDPHPDEEDYETAFDFGRHQVRNHLAIFLSSVDHSAARDSSCFVVAFVTPTGH
jgi:hypothetical protein